MTVVYDTAPARPHEAVDVRRQDSTPEDATPLHTTNLSRPQPTPGLQQAECVIVGAGPAGAVLALLLARQGVHVTLLEAHVDFNRDFRGDTLMPSTLELMDELGLTRQLQALPHARVREMRMETAAGSAPYLEVERVRTRFPYIMSVPQVRFLELITEEALRYPTFRLIMGAKVRALLEVDGQVRGVRYETAGGTHEIHAELIVGADGRFSKVRQLAGFELLRNDEARDMLWFRVRKTDDVPQAHPGLYTRPGVGYVVMVPRGTQWQVGYTLPKGRYRQLQAEGIAALRASVVAIVPWLTGAIDDLQTWQQASLLSVESGRVRRWSRPGVLVIGDAAHVMSPVGGVGINCAIQDAVVAANRLGPRLRVGTLGSDDLAGVQREREWQVRITQRCQREMQQYVVHAGERSRLLRSRTVRGLLMRVLALGVRRVHAKRA